MKKTAGDLSAKYLAKDVEIAAVQLFLQNTKVKVENNRLIRDIINTGSSTISSIKEILQPPTELNELVTLFELLIPLNDRKLNGAFFTPSIITNYMASELISSEHLSICDPSCGCGAFLIACSKRLQQVFKKPYYEIFAKNIYGADILDYGIRRCKILLSLLAILDGEDQERFDFNILSTDSLDTNWNELFPGVTKFDVVIGNPPYVKFQDLPIRLREDLYNNWTTLRKGTYNLYFAFFELGLSLLKATGRLGYIVPNNYFTSLAAIDLRGYLHHSRTIDKIIDFNHLKIFDVQTYTCITFLANKPKERDYFLYHRVKERSHLNDLPNIKYSKVLYESLNVKKWRLLNEFDQLNVRKTENQSKRLSHIADIHVGIATLKDKVYFIDGRTLSNGYFSKFYNGETYLIEESITRPVVKISDFKDEISLRNNSRRIIFPYTIESENPRIIPEHELMTKYPQCLRFLRAAKQELATREKGREIHPAWYAYARTQGLTFRGEKLLTPTFSNKPRFLYEAQEEVLFCNGYGIFMKKGKPSLFDQHLDIKVLQKILNSKVMGYYVSQTSYTIEGDYPCYQKNFIELFGIPDFTVEEIEFLRLESNQLKIDDFLTIKYDLNSIETFSIESVTVNTE